MKCLRFLVPAVALGALASLPLGAQQPAEPTQPAPNLPQQQPGARPAPASPSQPGEAVPAPSTANSPEMSNADLRPVSGELVSKLDTKSAKNGDPVVLKTTEKATIGDGVVIPKGSKITGHITDIQAHDETNPNSKVAIQFDQAELKGGQTVPIKSVLQSIEPAASSDSAQGGSMGPGGGAPSASMPSGGSAPSTGASAPGSSPSATSQPSMQSPSAAAPASPSGGGAPSGYPAAGTVVARQGNIEIKTTAIPGVLIAGNSNGMPFSNASGALLGARQNVKLDNGTRVTLAIANANPSNTR